MRRVHTAHRLYAGLVKVSSLETYQRVNGDGGCGGIRETPSHDRVIP